MNERARNREPNLDLGTFDNLFGIWDGPTQRQMFTSFLPFWWPAPSFFVR
jgi:hypothetical protein